MKKIILYIITLVIIASCSNYKTITVKNTTSLNPDIVKLEIKPEDLIYLGKTEITAKSRIYLGFLTKLDSINGEPYNYQDKKEVHLSGFTEIRLKGNMQKASYKAINQFPDASFYIPGNYIKKQHQMFLGKWITQKMEIHAYKYKIQEK